MSATGMRTSSVREPTSRISPSKGFTHPSICRLSTGRGSGGGATAAGGPVSARDHPQLVGRGLAGGGGFVGFAFEAVAEGGAHRDDHGGGLPGEGPAGGGLDHAAGLDGAGGLDQRQAAEGALEGAEAPFDL